MAQVTIIDSAKVRDSEEPEGSPPLRWRAEMATLAAYLLAGAVTGVLAGLLARLAMRGVVYIVGGTPGFSLEGTLGITALFAMLGLIVAAIYLVALRWLPRNMTWRAALVTAALLLVTLPFFFTVATGDLPDRPLTTVAALMLLFVPLPILMALGVVLWGARLQRRFVRTGGAHTINLAWATLFVVAPILLIVNMLGAAGSYMRHPLLLSQVMGRLSLSGDAAMNMGVVQSRALLIAIVVMSAWATLTALLFYRDVCANSSPLRASLLMALPIFTLTAAGDLPPLLAWLPSTEILLGSVQAIGVALLLLAVALSEPDRPLPRWTIYGVALAWGTVAAWLIVPAWRDNEPLAWLAWVAMASALVTLIVLRPTGKRGWRASTTLLALFALAWQLVWVVGMSVEGMVLSGFSGFQTALSAPIFWLPWLLIPIAALTTVRERVEEHAPMHLQGEPLASGDLIALGDA